MSNTELGQDLAEIINGLSDDEIKELSAVLQKGNQQDFAAQLQKIVPALGDYQIEFLGGGNSKNFKVTDNDGNVTVLKYDFGGKYTSQAVDKAKGALGDTLLAAHTSRNSVEVVPYCGGGSVLHHAETHSEAQRLQQAGSIFRQMAELVGKLESEDVAHPDMKNSNWLIEDGKLRIADTKALIITDNGIINEKEIAKSQRKPVMFSPSFVPGEFVKKGLPARMIPAGRVNKEPPPDTIENAEADKAHAYILGKNIYQYLTNCEKRVAELREEGMDLSNKLKVNPNDRVAQKRINEVRSELAIADPLKKMVLCRNQWVIEFQLST